MFPSWEDFKTVPTRSISLTPRNTYLGHGFRDKLSYNDQVHFHYWSATIDELTTLMRESLGGTGPRIRSANRPSRNDDCQWRDQLVVITGLLYEPLFGAVAAGRILLVLPVRTCAGLFQFEQDDSARDSPARTVFQNVMFQRERCTSTLVFQHERRSSPART